MHGRPEYQEEVEKGFQRGTYKWTVKNLAKLRPDDVLESNLFEIGNLMWKVVLKGCRCLSFHPSESIGVFLVSCNDFAVYADVQISVLSQEPVIQSATERVPRIASPFCDIEKLKVFFSELWKDDSLPDDFRIEVDLKNIHPATESERKASGNSVRTVHVEVIDQESINRALNGSGSPRIVLSNRKRAFDVCGKSFAKLWAKKDPDCRYWICARSVDGKLFVKQCLNVVKPFVRFDNVCDQVDGEPWVVFFREEKTRMQDFPPIDSDTILVFCLVSDTKYSDLSYLGHYLVHKRMLCWKFSSVISKMAGIREEQTCQVFVDGEDCCKTDISRKMSSLEEYGVYSGCSIILTCPELGPRSEQDNPAHAEMLDAGQDGEVVGDEASASTSNQQRLTEVDLRRGAQCRHRCGHCMAIEQVTAVNWVLLGLLLYVIITLLLYLASSPLTNPGGGKLNCDNNKLLDD